MHQILSAPAVRTRTVAALALIGVAAGCATIVEGTSDPLTVITEPAGAVCTIERGGTVIGVVNPAPGTVELGKSKDDAMVTCEKDGHEPATAALRASFQGMTFGNVLLGGVVGVAIDAGSGAMNKYPETVSLTLAPIFFETEADRDAFYERAIAKIEAEAQEARATVEKNCNSSNAEDCAEEAAAIDQERLRQVQLMEAARSRAKVGAIGEAAADTPPNAAAAASPTGSVQ
ncbi:MAG: hypothetical protein AAFV62_06205 [Pseudomonadota bacterium]